jgi:hypothetical protein
MRYGLQLPDTRIQNGRQSALKSLLLASAIGGRRLKRLVATMPALQELNLSDNPRGPHGAR